VSEKYSQFPLAAREDFESDLQFTLTFINKPKKNKKKTTTTDYCFSNRKKTKQNQFMVRFLT